MLMSVKTKAAVFDLKSDSSQKQPGTLSFSTDIFSAGGTQECQIERHVAYSNEE